MGRMSVSIAVLAALLVTYLGESDGRTGGARSPRPRWRSRATCDSETNEAEAALQRVEE